MPLDVDAVVSNPKLLNDAPLKVAVRMAESDLGFLNEYAPDMIRSLPAKLKLNADVVGTVSKPLIKAAVDLDVNEVSWAKADMPSVRDVKVRLRVNDRVLNIEDVSLMMAGGRVKLGGTVDAKDTANPAMNLKVEAREALVFRDPTTSLRANADITCVGTLKQARVAGLVEAVRGRVFKEIDLMPVLKLPADVPPVPENTQRSSAKLELPPMLKDWTFDLRVKTRDPLLVSGNLANGAISADVLLGGTGAAPQLTGGANIDRLLLKLPFSLVKITKGVVTMNPLKPFDPALDIRGESRIGSNDITLYIYGDSTNPKTRFTSTPPMSEADIVTLLGTGTTLSGSGSDLAAEAASRAAFLFISEFYRKTFNKKKVVREEPPRLHMTFNPSGADRSNDSVQAAYDLTDHWRVSARFTQTGRMKALLGWVLRFGKAAQAVGGEARTTNGE
jgi:autotransporter translocation and assembly factor TamB